jgi:hypothetical protein
VAVEIVPSGDRKIRCFVPDVLRVDGVEIAFAKGEVINGVEQVGLAGGVVANKTIHTRREIHIRFSDIFEIM